MQEIRTEHLTVGYEKKPLIGDVNLSVRPGEILTLIGPNGSGKSTILKTITKQLKKLDGTVFLGENSMDELKDSQISKRLSMVMTERLRTELMSGREVVASGRYPYTGRFGILSKEDWVKVDEDASYEKVLVYDVSELEPQLSCPQGVDNVHPISEILGTKMDEVYIGSCTNGSLEDMRIAAEIMKGKKDRNLKNR